MIPWSYSFLRDLTNCPHKAYRRFVTRDLPREDTPELREGNEKHEQIEKHINSKGETKVPFEIEMICQPMIEQGAKAEVKLGMTEDWRPAPFFGEHRRKPLPTVSLYDPKLYDSNNKFPYDQPTTERLEPWGRGKLDVLLLSPPAAFLVDWKTGKVKEDKRELEQQALLVRANYPEIHRISGCYVWLKESKMGPVYDLTDVNRVYHATVAQMRQAEIYEKAGDWPKTPNPLCGWCNVIDCEHRRDR